MGNRGLIVFKDEKIAIYLHWNGGRDSVEAFLEYAKIKRFRSDNYGVARLCQVIGNYVGGTLSLGLEPIIDKHIPNLGDNGAYIVDDFNITDRLHYENPEQNSYSLLDMLIEIDKKQPQELQLTEGFLRSKEIKYEDLKIGDVVYYYEDGIYNKHKIIGVGDSDWLNGRNVIGKFYIDRWNSNKAKTNVNNYLLDDKYRVA